MLISVIVCTYNREKYIGNLLDSLAANTLPVGDYEILLIDNNCTDRTPQVCEAFRQQHPDLQFRYLQEREQGLSAARNKGIQEARGEVLVYVDDDALVDKDYLTTYAEFFISHPHIQAAGGPILPLYETQEPEWMSPYTKALLTAYMYYGDKVRRYPHNKFPGGGNAAYRREVFEQVGKFNTALGRKGISLMGAEEKDIFDKMRAMGMSFYYLPNAVLHHIIPQTKLERDYFDRLTLQIGQSERRRTQEISRYKYIKRLGQEVVKWGGTIVLWLGYLLQGQLQKGNMLILFRRNVTKGLLEKN